MLSLSGRKKREEDDLERQKTTYHEEQSTFKMPKESHPNSRKNLIFCCNPIQMKTVDDNLHGEIIQK